ncbi:MAG: YceI family protein [Kofleriaceae bacterium]
MKQFLTSAWLPIVAIDLAVVASLARWGVQGSHNIYTAVNKRFYVPDPDLGWRISTQHPIWLGLEVVAAMLAMSMGLAVMTILLRKRKPTIAMVLARIGIPLALVSLVIPIAAFASGPGPLDGRDTLPASDAVKVEGGIEGALDAPAGTYTVVRHEGTAVTAHLSAGGEAFDARFVEVAGSLKLDPHDLKSAIAGDITVATASVDTGVGERSKHAREAYLKADTFPNIEVKLDRVIAVRQSSPSEIVFRAPAQVLLLGKTHNVEVTGTVTRPDPAALQRLALTGDVLLVKADFALVIADTALAPDAHDFDGDRFPLHVSLVLRKSP